MRAIALLIVLVLFAYALLGLFAGLSFAQPIEARAALVMEVKP